MTTFRHTWTKFSPSEAEHITGVDVTKQRSWRRHGFLSLGKGGWTQYEAPELAKMLVLQSLTNRGIGPAAALEDAWWASLGVIYHALKWSDSIDDKTVDREFSELYKHVPGGAAGFVCRKLSKVIPGGRFWVWWTDGSGECVEDLQKAFSESSGSEKYCGAVVVLDLEALGGQLLDRAGRPLVSIECEEISIERKGKKKNEK